MNAATRSSTTHGGGVHPDQRYTHGRTCRVCGGSEEDPRGAGSRCYGYLSDDEKYARCTRDEHAGSLTREAGSNAFPHKLQGDCKCSRTHGVAIDEPKAQKPEGKGKKKSRGTLVARHEFPYRDEHGKALYREVRQEYRTESGGKDKQVWAEVRTGVEVTEAGDVPTFKGFPGCMKGVRLVLFDLPELLAAPLDTPIFVVEGPKKARALQALSLIATTNTFGAGKWRDPYAEALTSRVVVVLPDENQVGRDHAETVARSVHPLAASVRVVPLPGLAEGEDVVDWLAKGGTADELRLLAAEAPLWEPEEPTSEEPAPEEPPDPDDLDSRVCKAVDDGGIAGLLKDEGLLKELARVDQATLAPIISKLKKHRNFSSRDFKKCLDKHRPKPKPGKGPVPLIEPVYVVVENCLAFLDDDAPDEGPAGFTQLANFTAKIIGEEVRDDGDQQTRVYKIAGKTKDGMLLSADVPAGDFESMGWVAKGFGPKAIINAGRKIKDHTRAAIQYLSGDISTRIVYTHTGWRRFGDDYFYLHSGGAIGADGLDPSVRVDLSEYGLDAYELPEPPEGEALKAAIRASLGILKLGQPERPGSMGVAAVIIAEAYRAVIAPVRHSTQFSGITGSHKTCLAALAQQHFGWRMNFNHMPAGYNSTSNALSVIRHILAYSLLVVDDFVPGGTKQDRAKAEKEGEDLFQTQGNGQGRKRMNADGTLQKTYDPRSSLMTTGEERVSRNSAIMRTLGIWVEKPCPAKGTPGTVDREVLTRCQADADAGIYAQSMAGFVRYLAPNFAEIKDGMPARALALRELATRPGDHGRTPDIVATLAAGFDIFLEFALASGAITAAEAEHHRGQVWDGLMEAAEEIRADHQSSVDPATLFLNLINSALISKMCYLADKNTDDVPDGIEDACGWRHDLKWMGNDVGQVPMWDTGPNAKKIGWTDGELIYLEPELAYNAAQSVLNSRNETLPPPISLHRLLDSAGKVAKKELCKDKDTGKETVRLTPRVSIAKKQRRILAIRAADIFGEDEGREGQAESDVLPLQEAVA